MPGKGGGAEGEKKKWKTREKSKKEDIMKKLIFSLITVTLLLSIPLVLSTSAYGQGYEFVLKWGSQGSGDGQFLWPSGVAVDSNGNVYVSDTWNHRIQKFDSEGFFISWLGGCDYPEHTGSGHWHVPGSGHLPMSGGGNGQFNGPMDIGIDSADNVYVLDTHSYRIQKFDSNGNFITKWGSPGLGEGEFNVPEGLAVDSAGNVYVADTRNARIQLFDTNGTFIKKWGSPGSGDGEFIWPKNVAVNSAGFVYVADTNNGRIQIFDSSSNLIDIWEIGTWGVAVDSSDNFFVLNGTTALIMKFDSNGNFITEWGCFGSGDGCFYGAKGIAFDSEGNVYVAGWNNHRIQKFAPPYIDVTIDIKPGSYPNTINLGSNGNIPVAIFSTEDFDATTVDPLTITLAGTEVRIRGKGDPSRYYQDVDGDGVLDVLVHIDARTFTLSETDTEAVLEGYTDDGQKIRGTDTVRIINE
jgi:sugar lactone lactonase YvrE